MSFRVDTYEIFNLEISSPKSQLVLMVNSLVKTINCGVFVLTRVSLFSRHFDCYQLCDHLPVPSSQHGQEETLVRRRKWSHHRRILFMVSPLHSPSSSSPFCPD